MRKPWEIRNKRNVKSKNEIPSRHSLWIVHSSACWSLVLRQSHPRMSLWLACRARLLFGIPFASLFRDWNVHPVTKFFDECALWNRSRACTISTTLTWYASGMLTGSPLSATWPAIPVPQATRTSSCCSISSSVLRGQTSNNFDTKHLWMSKLNKFFYQLGQCANGRAKKKINKRIKQLTFWVRQDYCYRWIYLVPKTVSLDQLSAKWKHFVIFCDTKILHPAHCKYLSPWMAHETRGKTEKDTFAWRFNRIQLVQSK